jgi:undecaprenyl-diphosphatase
MHEIEKKIVLAFNRNRFKVFDGISIIISNIPFLVISWILIGLFALHFALGILIDFNLACVFLIHFVVSEGLIKYGSKLLSLDRVRPYLAYPKEIVPLGKKEKDPSFPSSHVAAMTGGFAVISYYFPHLLVVAIVSIVLVAWSRIRNGMHYPSDILAGILLGSVYGYLAILFTGKIILYSYFFILSLR